MLAGHSAGTQFIQRHAVLNNVDEDLRKKGLEVRYVVANPPPTSTLRRSDCEPTAGGFASYERGICPIYNQYKYGLDQLPAYLPGRGSRRATPHAMSPICWAVPTPTPSSSSWTRAAVPRPRAPRARRAGLGHWHHELENAQRHSDWPPLAHQAQKVVEVGHNVGRRVWLDLRRTHALLGKTSAPLTQQGAACLPITR